MTTRSEDAPNIAEADFLAELKSQFDKDIDLRKTLDNKANTMITVISGIITLLIAIGTFLISRIVEKNIVYDISIGILASGVVLATVSICTLYSHIRCGHTNMQSATNIFLTRRENIKKNWYRP
jgi:hypothetical protein